VAGHPLVELGVAASHQRRAVRKTDVLLRAGAEPVLPVGPAADGLPVGGHRGAFDGDHVGRVDTHVAQFGGFSGDGDGLRAGTDDGKGAGHGRIPTLPPRIRLT
jgi:hypothetical protein